MATPVRRWRAGWDDVASLGMVAFPLVVWAVLVAGLDLPDLCVAVVAVGGALLLKHLAPVGLEDLAIVPIVGALLVDVSTLPLTVVSLVLAAGAGVGLLVWAGADPEGGVTLGQQLEPAVVPALAGSVAVAVTLFLPSGTGGQVGLAALVLVGVLALSAWLYLQSAVDVGADRPTS